MPRRKTILRLHGVIVPSLLKLAKACINLWKEYIV